MDEKRIDTRMFSTRSENKAKNNPTVPGAHILGLDMGYSGPKCVYENGNFVFPNYCEKINGPIFGELNKTDMIYENLTTKEKYFVGSKAIKDLDEDSVVSEGAMFERNHYLNKDFQIIFETALGMSLWNVQTDGTDVFIQTGLPPAYLKSDTRLIKKIMSGTHNFSLTIGTVKKFFNLDIKEDSIDVMSQPMGTYYSVVTDDNGNITPNIKEYSGSRLMVFDGGFGTLDEFVIKNNQVVRTETNSDLGMRRVFDETRKLIENELGVIISIPSMQNLLRANKVKVNDILTCSTVEYPIDDYLDRANKIVRQEALDAIRTQILGLKYIFMTGGTGAAWYDFFKENLKVAGLSVLPGNFNNSLPGIYTNARGYYMYRLNLMKLKK